MSITAAAIGIIHAILPMQWVNEKIFKINEIPYEHLTYEKAEKNFDTVKLSLLLFFENIEC